MLQKLLSKTCRGSLLALLALNCGAFGRAEENAAATVDLSGHTDDSIRAVLKLVARHQMMPLKDGDYQPVESLAAVQADMAPTGIEWNYPWGVTLYGVLRSIDATGDKEAENYVLEHNRVVARYYAWLTSLQAKAATPEEWAAFLRDRNKNKIGGLMRLGNLDSCGAMGVQFIEGMLRHPEQTTPAQKEVVARIADWIAVKQDRLPDGTFWRPNSTDTAKTWKPGTLWIDDLYMGCPFLVRWAKYTGEPKHLTDAASQILHMAALLQDTDGTWFHAYAWNEQKHSPFKWGRANGWAMVAAVEVLSEMPENHPDRAKLLTVLRRHIDGIKPLQAPSGMWRQVLDKPELWEETSCTAMFAYSIARAANRGWIDASNMAIARKAFEGICQHIAPNGDVNDTCEGTNIGMEVSYYVDRKRPDNDRHGRGVVLLAGAEILAAKK